MSTKKHKKRGRSIYERKQEEQWKIKCKPDNSWVISTNNKKELWCQSF